MKTLTRNILSLLLGDIIYRILGFFVMVYLARVLDQNGFGVISFCLAILSYAMLVSNNGLTVLGTRIISGKAGDTESTANSIILLRVIHGVSALLILAVIFYFVYGLCELYFLLIIYLSYLLPSALIIEWFFQGKEQMFTISIGRILGIVTYLLFVLFFVTTKEHMILTPVGFVFGAWVNTLFLVVMFFKSGHRFHFRFLFRHIKIIWLKSLSLSISTSLSQIVLQMPPIILAILSSFESVGVFSVAFRLISIILVFDRLLSSVFFPAVCRWIQLRVDLQEYLKRSNRIVITFSFLFSLLILIFSKQLIIIIYGSDYQESIFVFEILIGYACLTFINTVFTYTIIALQKENIYLRSLTFGTAGFLLCFFVLSDFLGPAAPAVGLVVYAGLGLFFMNHHIKNYISLKSFLIVILLFCMLFLVMIPLFEIYDVSLYWRFIVGVFIGIPFILILTGIRISDYTYLKKITL